jgi:lysophospholipase L1-like esterase
MIAFVAMLVMLCSSSQSFAQPATRPAGAGAFRVVCFGDSITGDRPRKPYLHQYLKFADVLQAMIEARAGVGSAAVLNRGWAGDATFPKPGQGMPGAVARLKEDVIDERPDVAVILIGGNDAGSKQVTPEQTRENLRAIARSLKEAGVRAVFLQYAVLLNPEKPDKAWTHLASNNATIAAVAEEFGFPTLALQPAFDAASKVQPLGELVNLTDGVHLAPGGELLVAKAVYAKLSELNWLPPAR